MTKVYLAQEQFDYEGATVIGVYSTKEKAIAACELHWKEKDDTPLVWKNGSALGWNRDHHFDVLELDVDETL